MPCRALIFSIALALPAGFAFAQQPAARQPAAAPQAAPAQQQVPACVKQFLTLREDAAKKATYIKAASDRRASPTEACGLLKNFVDAEAKVVKYAEDQGVWCGIPPNAMADMKKSHAQSIALKTRVCQTAAAGGGRPAGPSLSDALGAPTSSPSAVKPGRGTFDTLTGSPLGGAR